MNTHEQEAAREAVPLDLAQYLAREEHRASQSSAKPANGLEWSEVLAQIATLPDVTPEQRAENNKRIAESERANRLANFRRVCPPEFCCKIERDELKQPEQFDRVAQWDGSFPGPLAFGKTGGAKTRAAWSALCRLYVNGNRSFAWFPVKRLITELSRYEAKDCADEFWRMNRGFNALLVDDLDKINWQFESEGAMLFQFYDWAYRERRPVITTTNKDRAWWSAKMGDAFARRLFDEAHFAVEFK